MTWFPRLADSPGRRVAARDDTRSYAAWEYARDLGNYTTLRRMYSSARCSRRWSTSGTTTCTCRSTPTAPGCMRWDYDQTIRKHALGRFEDLLVACSLHPAMLLYLDNAKSVRGAPNENQGRELLELHTLGRTSGYTEQMVKDSAKILSGWTVDEGPAGRRTTTPASTPPGRCRCSGSPTRTAPPTAATLDRPLPALPGQPPGHRADGRAPAGGPVRLRHPLRRAGRPSWPGSSPPAAPTSPRPCARWSRTEEFAASARPEGPHARSTTWSRRSGCSASPRRRRSGRRPRSPNAIAWLPRSMLLYQLAAPGRRAGDERRLGVRRPDARVVPDALAARRRLLPRRAASATAARPPGCRSADPPRPVRRPPVPDAAGPPVDVAATSRRSARPPAASPGETVTSEHPFAS